MLFRSVAVVAIDAAALRKYGPWPWPRSYIAKLVDTLTADKAEAVALSLDLSAPQNAAALDYLGQLKTLSTDPETGSASVKAKLDEAEAALDTDSILAASILRSGHVLLAAPGDVVADAAAPNDSGSPSFALQVDASSAPQVDLRPPLPLFAHAAHGVGYLSESDTVSQELPLLVQSDSHAIASLALLAAAAQLDVDASTIGIHTLGGVTLGGNTIGTDRHLQVLLRDSHAVSSVPQYSYDDVITGTVQPERLAGDRKSVV